jgi:hypothetical protein
MNMPKLPSAPTKEPGGPDLTTPQTPQKQLLVPFGLGPDPKDPLCAGLGREIIMMPRMMPGSLGSLKFTSLASARAGWSRSGHGPGPSLPSLTGPRALRQRFFHPAQREVAVASSNFHPGIPGSVFSEARWLSASLVSAVAFKLASEKSWYVMSNVRAPQHQAGSQQLDFKVFMYGGSSEAA